jgi:hypothetical protein
LHTLSATTRDQTVPVRKPLYIKQSLYISAKPRTLEAGSKRCSMIGL